MTTVLSGGGTSAQSSLPSPFLSAPAAWASGSCWATAGFIASCSGNPGVGPGKTGQCSGQASFETATDGQQCSAACPGAQRGQGSLGHTCRLVDQFSQNPAVTASANSIHAKASGQLEPGWQWSLRK